MSYQMGLSSGFMAPVLSRAVVRVNIVPIRSRRLFAIFLFYLLFIDLNEKLEPHALRVDSCLFTFALLNQLFLSWNQSILGTSQPQTPLELRTKRIKKFQKNC